MKVLLLEPAKFPLVAKKLMWQRGFSICDSKIISYDEIDILFVRLSLKIDNGFISKFKNLKYIVSPTTGLDHIDIEYARQSGIEVVSFYEDKSAIKNIRSTTELGIGILIALMRKIPQAMQAVQQGQWSRSDYVGSDINNKKVLIVGYGRLGRQIADVYDAFGAKVTIYDRSFIKSRYPYVSDLVSEIEYFDIISIHLSLNQTSYNFLDKRILSKINENAVVLNTSRGEVIDQEYLFWMIRNKKLGGIALDVVSQEFSKDTMDAINKLLTDCPNKVVITPHIGGLTHESLEFVEIEITKKMLSQLRHI
jgi:D-3-phosphoglycerate dehydrogenase